MNLYQYVRAGVLAGVAGLSACSGAMDGAPQQAVTACLAVQGPGVPGRGNAAGHGQPQRDDGEVSVAADGTGFRATRTVTLSNDFGGAPNADVMLTSSNGSIDACVLDGGGYRFKVRLEARGTTEAEARQTLDSMQVQHGDTLAANTLQLATRVEFLPRLPGQSQQRSASIVAGLPVAAAYRFRHQTTNGDVSALGFSGPQAQLGSSNGSLALDGRWDQTGLSTTNGLVAVSGDHAALDASTTNGLIDARLQTARSATARFSGTNTGIEVRLERRLDPGFDLTADTTNGRAEIRVAGTEAVGQQTPQHAQRRTPGYSGKPQQIEVRASTTNGNVLIRD
jgi:hypothetical protein